MTAEEFENKYLNEIGDPYDNPFGFAEAYHKHRVESITDELVADFFMLSDNQREEIGFTDWLKKELLKLW